MIVCYVKDIVNCLYSRTQYTELNFSVVNKNALTNQQLIKYMHTGKALLQKVTTFRL